MMSDEMREAMREVFDYLSSLSDDEFLEAMNSQPKTEWYYIFQDLLGDMTMGEWLEMQTPKSEE